MTHYLAALILIAGGSPAQQAVPRDARTLLRIESPAVTFVVLTGRTVVYEVPGGDRPRSGAPQRPAGSPAVPAPDGRFDRAKVDELVKALRAGAGSAPLTTQPVRERWLIPGLVPWPDPDGGVHQWPGAVVIWAGAFNYEANLEVRLPGCGSTALDPRKKAELKWAKELVSDFFSAAGDGKFLMARELLTPGMRNEMTETYSEKWAALVNAPAVTFTTEEILIDQDEAVFRGLLKQKEKEYTFVVRVVKGTDQKVWRICYLRTVEQKRSK